MSTMNEINVMLLQTLGLSKESARIVVGRLEELEAQLNAARAHIAELEKRLTSSERARQSLSDACDSLQAEIRELKAAPTPLPRPDKPGWWWAWNYGDEKWERVEVELPEAWTQPGMKWLPATPPPEPKNN